MSVYLYASGHKSLPASYDVVEISASPLALQILHDASHFSSVILVRPTKALRLTLTATLANFHFRGSNQKGSTKSGEAASQTQKSPSTPGQYLPGGKIYNGYLGSSVGENPRGNRSIPQWLQEWERKWDAITGDSKPESRTFFSCASCIHADKVKRNPSFDE